MIRLLDVNVLIAMSWAEHVHHAKARTWFDAIGAAGWAICPVAELGFIRVSSAAKFNGGVVTPLAAAAVLRQAIEVGRHEFWPDDVAPTESGVITSTVLGHKQVTDSYLLALAAQHGGVLATLDEPLVRAALASGRPAELVNA